MRVIARCPECQTRYRIAPEKIGPNGARIRCSECSAVFRVEPEAPEDADILGARVLVAEPDSDQAKVLSGYLRRWQIETHVIHDGAQALLFLHREKPNAVIIGARLPGLRGAELAEIVRRTSELAHIKLIRVVPEDETSASHFEADHTLEPPDLPDGLAPILERLGLGDRPPTRRAEAKPHVPIAPPVPTPPVTPVVEAPVTSRVEAPVTVIKAPVVAPPPPAPIAMPEPAPPVVAEPAPEVEASQELLLEDSEPPVLEASEPPVVEDAAPPVAPVEMAEETAEPLTPSRRRRGPPLSDDPEIAAAERLSRIIVSDIILYNDEKFAEGVEGGDVATVLAAELTEAGQLFEQRIPEAVRAKRPFLVEELERRAEAKRS